MLTVAAGSAGAGSALWFLSRATGVVTLALLTLVLVLGVLTRGGRPVAGAPRWVTSALHRNASLLAVSFLAVHIVTAVADPYAPIRLVDAVVPFISRYRPLWLGLGALALDIIVALVVTSMLRLRVGRRVFRFVHWTAYGVWPVALLHGLGTGSDVHARWLLGLAAACVVAVAAAARWRVVQLSAASPAQRVTTSVAAVGVPVALAAWLVAGPLAPHWAARAGTPSALLRHPASATTAATASSAGPALPTGTANVRGRLTDQVSRGRATVVLDGSASGGAVRHLRIVLQGVPDRSGGIQLTSGAVQVSEPGGRYDGAVTGLDGGAVSALLRGPAGTVRMSADLTVDAAAGRFAGTVTLQ